MILELGAQQAFDITHRALVMGILNRTPDSFYDRGKHWSFDDFLRLAEEHVKNGADFLDIGGVKAGPGLEVTEAEELERTIPGVEALTARFDIPLSIDTWRGSVASAAFEAGACIGNDISGFSDPTFLPTCVKHEASVVATHVRIGPRIPDPNPHYHDLKKEVKEFLAERARWALEAGIPQQRIMIDAGLDLGKTPTMSTELLRNSDDLLTIGHPVFLSASNKGFLGELSGTDINNRQESSWAAHALGILLGCRILRAHDVRGSRRISDVMEAVLKYQSLENL